MLPTTRRGAPRPRGRTLRAAVSLAYVPAIGAGLAFLLASQHAEALLAGLMSGAGVYLLAILAWGLAARVAIVGPILAEGRKGHVTP